MIVHILLNGLNRCILQLIVRLRINLLDFLQVIKANVLISIGLEDITSNLTPFKARCVDEVAVLTTSTAVRSMVVAAGDGAKVARLDQLVGLKHGLLGSHLVELGHLDPFLLIHLLEFDYLLVCKRDQYLRSLARSLLKQATNVLFLLYEGQKRVLVTAIKG